VPKNGCDVQSAAFDDANKTANENKKKQTLIILGEK
jgi:hypothetical protein